MFDVAGGFWPVFSRIVMINKNYLMRVPAIDCLDEMTIGDAGKFLEINAPKFGINCVNWEREFPYHPITVFSIAHSKRYIYVNFFVRCNYLRAVNYENNKSVSEDSCVEFFLQTQGSEEYWNFEFNCIGTVNASHRKERKFPCRLSGDEIGQIKRYASCGKNPFQELEGLFNWELVIALPFDLIGIDKEKFPIDITGNFYKCASATSMPHYLSWAPILTESPDFHRPEFFGKIILE